MKKWIQLHADDNVVIARDTIEAGEEMMIDGRRIIIANRISLANKLASKDIKPGEHIIKYGVPVGSAFLFIPAGGLVHTHNVRSDYHTASNTGV